MATWKKLVVSGSNVSQLNNDAGYLTAGTITQANGYATASANGVELLASSATASLAFASSSGQGLAIAATSGPNTLTFGLSAIPNSSLLNSGSIIGNTVVNLGTTVTSLTGLTNVSSTSFTGSLQGTASYADNAGLLDGLDSTAFVLNSQTSSMAVSSSLFALTASYALNGNSTLLFSGSTGNGSVNLASDVFSIIGTNNEIETSAATNTVQIGLPNDVTIGQDLIVTRNLTVFGTASFQNTENLLVADRFVLLASGSTTDGPGGIVVQQTNQNIGELFGWDSGADRWAVTGSYNANQSVFTPDAFMAAAINLSSTDPNITPPDSKYNKKGNIYVSSTANEDIWIYS